MKRSGSCADDLLKVLLDMNIVLASLISNLHVKETKKGKTKKETVLWQTGHSSRPPMSLIEIRLQQDCLFLVFIVTIQVYVKVFAQLLLLLHE